MIAGVPAITVKPFGKLATSEPVVIVMVRGPTMAVGSMFTTAVAAVGLLTVNDTTVTPASCGKDAGSSFGSTSSND